MLRLTCTGHEVYYASDEPRRFPLETDAMLRARLRRIMTTPAGLIAVSRAADDALWDDPGWQERAARRR